MPGNSNKLEASATFVLDRRGYNGNTASSRKQYTSSKSISRLKYQDFLPDKSTAAETFQHLLNKANDWLRRNPGLAVRCCETVTWMSHDPKRLGDNEMMTMSKKATIESTTYFVRGLRLWLIPKPAAGRLEMLCHRDFIPDRQTDSIQQLIAKANKKFCHTSNKSQILTTETVGIPLLHPSGGGGGTGGGGAGGSGYRVDSGLTEWVEPVKDDIRYAFVVRIYYVKDTRSKQYGSDGIQIGVKDMIPQPLEGPGGYEGFEELTDRANSWLKDQSDILVTNMQSLTVQKNAAGPHSETGSACYYSMPGISSEHPMEFFRILRVAFVKPLGNLMVDQLPLVYPFTFQTFAPEVLRAKADPATGSTSTAAAAERVCRMERMKETFSKALAYLRTTGAEVICAETVMNPMQFYTEEDQDEEDEEDEEEDHKLHRPDEVSFLFTIRLFVADQANGYNADVKRSSIVSSKGRSSPTTQDPDHPGPIFLRNVVTRRYKYRWLAVAIFAVTCMTVIVVLSVVYSNK